MFHFPLPPHAGIHPAAQPPALRARPLGNGSRARDPACSRDCARKRGRKLRKQVTAERFEQQVRRGTRGEQKTATVRLAPRLSVSSVRRVGKGAGFASMAGFGGLVTPPPRTWSIVTCKRRSLPARALRGMGKPATI